MFCRRISCPTRTAATPSKWRYACRDSDIEWRRFDFGAIAAAIISYCRAKRIPLPLSGVKSIALTQEGISFSIENQVNIAQRPEVRADIAGRPIQYAKGYEPHSISPSGENVAFA